MDFGDPTARDHTGGAAPDPFAKLGLTYDDVINDVPIDVGADHQGGNLIVISKIDGGKWVEVTRIDPMQSN